MPRPWVITLMFVSSWSPLLVMFGLTTYERGQRVLAISLGGAALVSVAVLALHLLLATRVAPHELRIKAAAAKDSDTMGYVATYLLPFVGIDLARPPLAVGVALLTFLVWRIYTRATLVYLNPLLVAFGFRIYEIEVAPGGTYALLSRRDQVRPGDVLRVVAIGGTARLEVAA